MQRFLIIKNGGMGKRLTTDEFIEKAKKVHGDKYDYSKVEYVDSATKIYITCPEHGGFWQNPNSHLHGRGCSMCAKAKANAKNSCGIDEFIEKAKKVHGEKYDYSKVEYVNSKTKVCIICPEHGEFWQTPSEHLNGCGCKKCASDKLQKKFQLSKQQFVSKSLKVHGDKYDYSKVEYVNNRTKVCIICPEHGEFWQTPNSHLNGNGCPLCGNEERAKVKKSNTDDFIIKAKKVHTENYSYKLVDYVTAKTPIKIICPKHGEFWQTPDKHLYGRGCPKCGRELSKGEECVKDYIENIIGFKINKNSRKIIPPYELDIFVPEKNLAIEYDGILWHSEKYIKDTNYHLNKTESCEKMGIRLIYIFEDEWNEHTDIVKSKLKHILGCDNCQPKVFARKCSVGEINNNLAKEFLGKNHIQGFARSTVYLGGFYGDKLIGVMSFKREVKNLNKWELTRFATDINKCCVGVGGKIFKYFIRNYNPSEVKSFADRRWSSLLSDNLYNKLGFKLDKILKPDYHYVIGNKRIHKFNCRKQNLLRMDDELNINMTEHEMCQKLGFQRIYDCGLIKYIWKNT